MTIAFMPCFVLSVSTYLVRTGFAGVSPHCKGRKRCRSTRLRAELIGLILRRRAALAPRQVAPALHGVLNERAAHPSRPALRRLPWTRAGVEALHDGLERQ